MAVSFPLPLSNPIMDWARRRNERYIAERASAQRDEVAAWNAEVARIQEQSAYADKVRLAERVAVMFGEKKMHDCGILVSTNSSRIKTTNDLLEWFDSVGGVDQWQGYFSIVDKPYEWEVES